MRYVHRAKGVYCFFFNDTATTEIYTLSLHDALPISGPSSAGARPGRSQVRPCCSRPTRASSRPSCRGSSSSPACSWACRSEEHTSELQSRQYLVCRLLLEKKKSSREVRMPACKFYSR